MSLFRKAWLVRKRLLRPSERLGVTLMLATALLVGLPLLENVAVGGGSAVTVDSTETGDRTVSASSDDAIRVTAAQQAENSSKTDVKATVQTTARATEGSAAQRNSETTAKSASDTSAKTAGQKSSAASTVKANGATSEVSAAEKPEDADAKETAKADSVRAAAQANAGAEAQATQDEDQGGAQETSARTGATSNAGVKEQGSTQADQAAEKDESVSDHRSGSDAANGGAVVGTSPTQESATDSNAGEMTTDVSNETIASGSNADAQAYDAMYDSSDESSTAAAIELGESPIQGNEVTRSPSAEVFEQSSAAELSSRDTGADDRVSEAPDHRTHEAKSDMRLADGTHTVEKRDRSTQLNSATGAANAFDESGVKEANTPEERRFQPVLGILLASGLLLGFGLAGFGLLLLRRRAHRDKEEHVPTLRRTSHTR